MSENKKMNADQEEILAGAAAESAAETEDSVDLIVKFRRPYQFEGQEYTQVDLSGLEDVSAGALQNVGSALLKKRPGLNPSTIEMTMDYANMLAARVTSLPLEFFERLPGKEGMKIKTAVVGFLYGGDGED
mgnify:CR=1 FL=1